MSDFDTSNLQTDVMRIVDSKVRAMLEDEAQMLKSFIQYEYMMSNIELASSWKMHGYDFKMMPQSFIEHIEITPVAQEGNSYTLSVHIGAESFKEEPEDKINFYKKYVLGNAMTKLKSRIGGM